MYDMYPEWGPAQHREAQYREAQQDQQPGPQPVQASLDLRDNGGERPDDN